MSSSEHQRGYNRARADYEGMIGAVECAATAQALHQKFAANRLAAQVNTANAVNQDMQARLQAAAEYIRFLDQGNVDLCAQIEGLCAKLQEWEEYGRTSQATMAQLRQITKNQREKIDTQKETIRELSNKLAYEYGF